MYGRYGRKNLGGVGEGKTIIRISCANKKPVSIKGKQKKKKPSHFPEVCSHIVTQGFEYLLLGKGDIISEKEHPEHVCLPILVKCIVLF